MFRKLVSEARKIDEFRSFPARYLTAAIGRDNRVRVFSDDGWEEILDHHFDVSSEQEGRERLLRMGFTEGAAH